MRVRRRHTRHPAGWLLIEAASDHPDNPRLLAGRLLDTSVGGLGLELSEALLEGSFVQVKRSSSAPEAADAAAEPWEGRAARVVYATPLPDGGYRTGLAFPPQPPSEVQQWGTRAILLGVLALVIATFFAGGLAPLVAAAGVAFVVLLAGGAEWQHRSEAQAYRQALARWSGQTT